ncbi:flagellar biosynthetic protein FliO [Sporosarcina sp. Sa2YVA2]|uniref:Flagellar biosynthetic protein FliO n=1 Tax=Sporosarcina quadrami TaxID=2762234 RepID=A0ABR8U690_9BACL|nr:flagellar biosynthetic protein FliO [Sporosarcina quadrami]MBD7983541.1 flagellar biosynthetic protein FliO [Sporosarcina quadrami]
MRASIISKKSLSFIVACLLFLTLPSLVAFADSDNDKFLSDLYKTDKDEKDGSPATEDKSEPAADRSKSEAASGSSWGDYVRMIFAFIFVIALLLALLKFLNRKNRMFEQHRLMKNMGGLSLGQQKSVQLVMIGDTYYLVGVGDEVRLLKEIVDPEEVRQLESYFGEDELNTSPGFINKIVTFISERGNARSNSHEEQDEFKNIFSARLHELKSERKKHLSRLEEKESRKDE